MECPFGCGYSTTDLYRISFHVETCHSDLGESPFATKDDESRSLALAIQCEEEEALRAEEMNETSRSVALSLGRNPPSELRPLPAGASGEVDYVECPVPDCGEYLHLLEYDDHLDIHASLDDPQLPPTIANMIGSDSGHEYNKRPSLVPGERGISRIPTAGCRKQQGTLSRTISPFLRTPSIKGKPVQLPVHSLAQNHSLRLGVS